MEQIKKLREMTGAGIGDCKKALDESQGDIEKAVEILRKKGIAKAAKRGDKEASEGVVKLSVNESGDEGYILEMSAETDFVVRNEKFQGFSDRVLEIIKNKKPANLDELMNINMENGTVKESLDSLSGTIGEKMEIKRFEILTGATVAAYSHIGGKIGVLVSLDKSGEKEMAYDIAMHIAAADPKYITSSEVPEEETNKEKEIYKEQLLKEGKPENIIDNILTGKINKYFSEVCLVDQEYIKDDKKKVKDILGEIKVDKFVRYSL
ncbi:MAG: translation elongation factor Ts [Candidatus Falkowbacteria bacterium]